MSLHDTIAEVGPLTVLEVLGTVGGDLRLMEKEIVEVLPVNPLIYGQDIRNNMYEAVVALSRFFTKRQIVLVGPELIFLEVLADASVDAEVFVAVDSILSPDLVRRVANNTPDNLNVKVVQIPKTPAGITPADSIIIVVGFRSGSGHALILQSARCILNYYRSFYFGEILFFTPLNKNVMVRPERWVTVNSSQTFTQQTPHEEGGLWHNELQGTLQRDEHTVK